MAVFILPQWSPAFQIVFSLNCLTYSSSHFCLLLQPFLYILSSLCRFTILILKFYCSGFIGVVLSIFHCKFLIFPGTSMVMNCLKKQIAPFDLLSITSGSDHMLSSGTLSTLCITIHVLVLQSQLRISSGRIIIRVCQNATSDGCNPYLAP